MTFDDLEGNEVTETFYFNYSKKEIAELLEFGRVLDFPAEPGFVYEPLEEMMKKLSTPIEVSGLSNTENNRMAYLRFQTLILDAFGKKGANNVNFDKTPELRHHFKTHVAFPELIFEFLGNERLAAEFFENCLPPKVVARVKEEQEAAEKNKISDSTIAEMNAEAARRQQDPATRIEPGLEAAQAAGVAPAHIVDPTPGKKIEDLTEQDILSMDEISFQKLDAKKLNMEQMQVAFRRKMQNG